MSECEFLPMGEMLAALTAVGQADAISDVAKVGCLICGAPSVEERDESKHEQYDKLAALLEKGVTVEYTDGTKETWNSTNTTIW